ncbi:putative serine esterase-domain-containing protein [Gautieria morchelliformis]|nr:putative serine esterase-domain-containing protein [Gautieria morchelliformis]
MMAQNIHLLVCIHGLWGSPDTLSELTRFIKAKYPASSTGEHLASDMDVDILVTRSNGENRTYDGIDWCAERIADEVEAHIMNIQANGRRKVTRFSVIGYSLGGLIARFLIGVFHSRGFFEDVEPYNFIAISTPHIGSPRYPGVLSSWINVLGPRLLSRSGEQLSLTDRWSSSQRPILEVMADKGSIFFKALSLFPHIHIYANAVNDVLVPYLTSAIELEDPFVTQNAVTIDLDEKYQPIIKTLSPTVTPPQPPCPQSFYKALVLSLKVQPLFPLDPLKFLIWIFSPILFLPLMVYAIVRLFLDTRASGARIRDLERRGARRASAPALLNCTHILKKGTDNVVAFADSAQTCVPTNLNLPGGMMSVPSNQPSLTSKQRSLVVSLNSLSQMHKHLALIDGVFNSHPVIICKDVGRIEAHKRGQGVLRHVTDTLVI